MTARILIIDDEPNVRRMIRALLETEGHRVAETTAAIDAQKQIDAFDPHVVLLDLIMPGGPDGIEVLETIRRVAPHIVVIMMSGKATLADAVNATKLGAFQFLPKPLTPEGVLVTVAAAYEVATTRADNRQLLAALRGSSSIVGNAANIEQIRQLIQRVAKTPTRVLITGESGTGKEVIAQAIHDQSDRANRPLISLNCAAIPRELIESELFGHERGAFTGATQRRRGKFEFADGGTIFLDEVGDLSLEAQAKLLRVLETGVVERVGDNQPRPVDVRVLAATNKDLDGACETGEFRSDLLYRLNVFPIEVPPLRDRENDVELLAVHFSTEFARRSGTAQIVFTDGALARLKQHHWPGNVRELANVVERLTILNNDVPVEAETIDAMLGAPKPPPVRAGDLEGLTETLAAFEADLIRDALRRSNGNVADAARRLKTDRANLYRRMRRLRIDPTQKRVKETR